jgi:hypothetical protein
MIISSSMVTVYVGPERTECILHENLLRHKSGFFDEILKIKTDDGLPKSITLPIDDPAVSGHFVSWLYKDSIYCSKAHGESDWEHLFEWCRLELFAKNLGLTSLEGDAIWQYGSLLQKRSSSSATNRNYQVLVREVHW